MIVIISLLLKLWIHNITLLTTIFFNNHTVIFDVFHSITRTFHPVLTSNECVINETVGQARHLNTNTDWVATVPTPPVSKRERICISSRDDNIRFTDKIIREVQRLVIDAMMLWNLWRHGFVGESFFWSL